MPHNVQSLWNNQRVPYFQTINSARNKQPLVQLVLPLVPFVGAPFHWNSSHGFTRRYHPSQVASLLQAVGRCEGPNPCGNRTSPRNSNQFLFFLPFIEVEKGGWDLGMVATQNTSLIHLIGIRPARPRTGTPRLCIWESLKGQRCSVTYSKLWWVAWARCTLRSW